MRSLISGHWDVCCMNSVPYRKFPPYLYISPSEMSVLLFYSFVFFRPPFTAYNQRELAEKIREGKFRRIPYRYSEELNTLLSKMLNLKVRIGLYDRHIIYMCYQLLTLRFDVVEVH